MLPPSKSARTIQHSILTIAPNVVHYTCVDVAAIIAQHCSRIAFAKALHVLIRYSQRDSTDSKAAPYRLSAFARYRRGHLGEGGQPYLHWQVFAVTGRIGSQVT